MTGSHVAFSSLSARNRSKKLKSANRVLNALLEKTVGSVKEDQAGWLLYHLKKLYPGGRHLSLVMNDFRSLDDYLTCSKTKRRSYCREALPYESFNLTLEKVSGSRNQESQRAFLNSRFRAIHGNARTKIHTLLKH